MPTYDYKCNDCGNTFELFQPMTAEPIKECPSCGGSVKRLIGTGAGPIFKGSGFYQTDYKSSSKSDSTKSDNKQKPDSKSPAVTPKPDASSKENK
ncbi:MAG: zinc ribbon domain-containing protein [Ignavibacteriales bacterium]|nr:MAG: zinc ribbon domain-containing protein [Ignavibacteriales bacterium]